MTKAEKLRRRTSNLCLYCGNPRHIARQCLQKLVKLQVQVVETPQELETRTSSHSRNRVTGSHTTPPLQRLLFRCWSQSHFHSVCGHHSYSRRHTTSVSFGGLRCHLFFHRPNICHPTQHPRDKKVNPCSGRGYWWENHCFWCNHTRDNPSRTLYRQAHGEDCSQHHLHPSPSHHPWFALARSTQPYHWSAV